MYKQKANFFIKNDKMQYSIIILRLQMVLEDNYHDMLQHKY